MKKYLTVFVGLLVLLIFLKPTPTSGWLADSYYVQKVSDDKAPILDGQFTEEEWNTQEEKFTDEIGSQYTKGSAANPQVKLVMLRTTDMLYVKISLLTEITDTSGNYSFGIALSDQPIVLMSSTIDRKIVNHDPSGAENNAQTFDLYNPKGDINLPGIDDAVNDVEAAYGIENEKPTVEMRWPINTNSPEDLEITEKTNIKVVVNPYWSIYEIGHGGAGSDNLRIRFDPRPFFERPQGPMDGLAKFFNLVFGLIISFLALAFLLAPRYDSIAEKLWKVEINEEMASKSILMEIAYYNSSFLSLFALFYFWVYSLIGVLYGIWANWGAIGLVITGIPFILSSVTMGDLIKRNHNPQDIPVEERRNLGKNVESTGALWILPPIFLGLTLFMLVFIGIDVVS